MKSQPVEEDKRDVDASTRAATDSYASCPVNLPPQAPVGSLSGSGAGTAVSDDQPADHLSASLSTSRKPRLILVTYNGNCWFRLKAYLRCTPANVVCIQEHKLLGDKLAEARIWAKHNGWAAFWAPAMPTPGGGLSGGVAVFVKQYIQCWVPKVDPIFCAHRGIGVVVNCGALGPCLIVSMYFVTNNLSKTTLTPTNSMLLTHLGNFITQVGHKTCIGADWNMEPHILDRSMFLESLGLVVIAAKDQIGSCISGAGTNTSTIDFFAMHKTLFDVTSGCNYCPTTPPRPHRPLVLNFRLKPKDVQVIVLKEPKKLSVDPPFGPPLPPHFLSDYSDVATQLQNRTGLAADSYYPVVDPQLVNTRQAVLSDCLAKWYAKAESDLIAQLGSKLKPSSRGEPSRAIKVNLINTFKHQQVTTRLKHKQPDGSNFVLPSVQQRLKRGKAILCTQPRLRLTGV